MNNNPNTNHTNLYQLHQLAAETVSPLGFEVLEVQQIHDGGELLVIIRIDRLDEQPVTMEDTIRASRALDAEFDRADPIEAEYRLEVESPGSKRPLTRARHFERMLGLKAKVKGNEKGAGFTGQIQAVTGNTVTFRVGDDERQVEAGEVTAHLAEFPDRHR